MMFFGSTENITFFIYCSFRKRLSGNITCFIGKSDSRRYVNATPVLNIG